MRWCLSVSADMFNARREGSGQVTTRGGRRARAKAVAHHMPLTTAPHPSMDPPACRAQHGMREGQGRDASAAQGASFSWLLFFPFCSIKRSPLFAPGLCTPPPPKACCKCNTAREILMVQSQGRRTARRDEISPGAGAAPGACLLLAAHHLYHDSARLLTRQEGPPPVPCCR
jgi:hypothetical protein